MSYNGINRSLLLLSTMIALLVPVVGRFSELMSWFPMRCWSQALFGRVCPMCDLSRAALALTSGDIGLARAWNGLIVPLAAFLALQVIWRIFLLIAARPPRPARALIRADWIIHALLAVLLLGVTVCRLIVQPAGWL